MKSTRIGPYFTTPSASSTKPSESLSCAFVGHVQFHGLPVGAEAVDVTQMHAAGFEPARLDLDGQSPVVTRKTKLDLPLGSAAVQGLEVRPADRGCRAGLSFQRRRGGETPRTGEQKSENVNRFDTTMSHEVSPC